MTTTTDRRMDLRLIARAGAARKAALERADDRLDAIADELIACGERANVRLAAEVAGVSRGALIRRIASRRAR